MGQKIGVSRLVDATARIGAVGRRLGVHHDVRAGNRLRDLLLDMVHKVVRLPERQVAAGHDGEVDVPL